MRYEFIYPKREYSKNDIYWVPLCNHYIIYKINLRFLKSWTCTGIMYTMIKYSNRIPTTFPLGIAIVDTDGNDCIIYDNDATENIWLKFC